MLHVYVDDTGDYVIPDCVVKLTKFRKCGAIDRRYKNKLFWEWLVTERIWRLYGEPNAGRG